MIYGIAFIALLFDKGVLTANDIEYLKCFDDLVNFLSEKEIISTVELDIYVSRSSRILSSALNVILHNIPSEDYQELLGRTLPFMSDAQLARLVKTLEEFPGGDK